MEFPYEPDAKGDYRPIIGILFYRGGTLLNTLGLPIKCLVDTGALHTMLCWEVADLFGVDLSDAEDHPDLRVGGERRTGIKVLHLSMEIPSANGHAPLAVPDTPILFVKGELPTAGLLGSTALRPLVTVFREYEAVLNIRPALDFRSEICPHYNGVHPL